MYLIRYFAIPTKPVVTKRLRLIHNFITHFWEQPSAWIINKESFLRNKCNHKLILINMHEVINIIFRCYSEFYLNKIERRDETKFDITALTR